MRGIVKLYQHELHLSTLMFVSVDFSKYVGSIYQVTMSFVFLTKGHGMLVNHHNYPQGVDLAYLQTGISGVFLWVLNFENLYFFGCLALVLYFLVC